MNIKSIKKNIKKNKAFTLIELLVVVAIIGILASVGTVAYNGYTAAAQEAASRTKHNTLVKYISSELARCLVSPATTLVLANNGIDGIQCSTVRNNNAIQNQIALFTFANFENPYGGGAGVATGTVDIDPTAQGMTTITDDLTQIQIRTRVVTGGAVLAAALVK
jgi:type IV pilus assembly protein PilA